MIHADMNFEDRLNEVQKLHGNSYTFMDMPIDEGNCEISQIIKNAQAREFFRVAKLRLYVQQKMLQERRRQPEIDNQLEVEFKDFRKDEFLPMHLNENELADIIIGIKIQGIEVKETKKERWVTWVMNHSKY